MKKIIKSTLTVALLTVAGYGAYTSNESNQMSELALANVEALAEGEVTIPYICAGDMMACYDSYYPAILPGIKVY